MKKQIYTAIFLLTLLAACTQATAEPNAIATPTPLPTPIVPEKPTYVVERGTVINTLEFTGRVSPVVEQELFFKSDGFVDEVFVQRGEQVKMGDVLAQLEITDLENQLAQAQVALETAELTLNKAEQDLQDNLLEAQINRDKIQIQLDQQQINTNSANTVSAQIELENAQERLADAEYELQKSLDREWEPEQLRQQYERGVESAQEALAIAQARYSDALASNSSGSVDRQILEQDLELANLRIAQLDRGVDPLLALDVERARLEVQKIETSIADAQLIAPFDGEVLSMGIRAGSRAGAFETAVVLAQPDTLEITANLSSEQLTEMSIGQFATILLRDQLEDPFDGMVRQLPYAFSGGATNSNNDDTRARIQFENPPANLELGELATITIVLEEKSDAFWLPPAAIRTFQGRTFVVIEEADGQRRVDVRLGIESEARVEILEGVVVGDVVVGE